MSTAVTFGTYDRKVQIQRRPKNPLDKCTIVSVYPKFILDYKPTAFPQSHRIEGAEDNDFTILVVEAASWYKEMEEGQPWLEIPIPSTEVARAFIQDWVNGLPEYIPETAAPGVFFVLGAYDKVSIKKYVNPETKETFDQMLAKANVRQREWFRRIVEMSDKDWARTNGNPRSVGDIARLGAEKLGLTEKPWIKDYQTVAKTNCQACGQLVNPAFPICPNCKAIINEVKAKELGIKFAS